MLKVAERNKAVKKILAANFGNKNVSVVGGKGTAYGWCKIKINIGERLDNTDTYTPRECEKMHEISQQAESLLKDIEFYHYYGDMDNDPRKELIIEARFDRKGV